MYFMMKAKEENAHTTLYDMQNLKGSCLEPFTEKKRVKNYTKGLLGLVTLNEVAIAMTMKWLLIQLKCST